MNSIASKCTIRSLLTVCLFASACSNNSHQPPEQSGTGGSSAGITGISGGMDGYEFGAGGTGGFYSGALGGTGANAGTNTSAATGGTRGGSGVGGVIDNGTGGIIDSGVIDGGIDSGISNVGGIGGDGGAGGSSVVSGGYAENTGADCQVSGGALEKNPELPDPFAMHDGNRITTKAQWKCRRDEIKADIEKYEIGPKPEPSQTTVAATLSGNNLSVEVTSSSGSLILTSAVSGSGSCVVIGMNMDLALVSGCTKLTFSANDVVSYAMNSTQNPSDPFYKVFPSLWGKIGNYTAWSWGVSRLIDGLEQVKDKLKIDMTKIATHGCSYAGKMSLFAGAMDERVALTIVQESGGGGINSWRTSQDFTTRTGTNIEKIDNTNYSWFMPSMKTLDPYSLPHDHHELIAMIAPRATIILGNPGYEWLGDESGYKSTMAAAEIFKAMGVADHIGYDFTGGHTHCLAAASQVTSVNTFVDRFLKGTGTSSDVAINPSGTTFDLDYSKVIDWTTPNLQ
ncbi:MAG: hypothetical protein JXA30_13200 [Deltaproteobacteria bacterium]|nr:hypothetical protein [Deltaproteobacteria bacterium]